MNRWDCDSPACGRFCLGVGAIGLRAIGWYVKFDDRHARAPEIFCPLHRPDTIACREDHENPECSECKAEREAKTIQDDMYTRDDERAVRWAGAQR